MSDENLPTTAATHLPAAPESPMAILRVAVEQNIDAASIEKLAALAWKQQDRDAAKEFADALREFKRKCPSIHKSKAGGATKAGTIAYYYAPLDKIAAVVDPILDSLGLSYSWDSSTDGTQITTTCVLRHVNGHRETASFTCPATEGTGIMSGAQKAASAMSFSRRQTLTAILGVTTADSDTDGREVDTNSIDEGQVANLRDLISAADLSEARFLRMVKVDRFDQIFVSSYDQWSKWLQGQVKGAK